MNVTCRQCATNISIPKEKVPKGQAFSIRCPKCKNKVAVPAVDSGARALSTKVSADDQIKADAYEPSIRPLDFIEEGVQTALVCESNPALRAKVKAVLQARSYHVVTPVNARDVLKQMRFHNFDLLAINERFDAINPDENNVLRYLDRLSMSVRREMFSILLTDRYRTLDNMAAFTKSVHVVLNVKHIDEFDKVLSKAFNDNNNFYRIFKEVHQKARLA